MENPYGIVALAGFRGEAREEMTRLPSRLRAAL
jgi:hypothetical protein